MIADRWEVENFFTEEECEGMIQFAEDGGFQTATLNVPGGETFKLEYRNNDRLIFDSPELAETLWERIQDHLPRLANAGWECVGLNERFKVYKYSDEQHFAPHFDGNYIRTPFVEQSWVTLLVYLNEDFDGGETVFQTLNGDFPLKPKTGLAAFMTQNNILHEAMPATNGTKYVLRTDIMYRRTV